MRLSRTLQQQPRHRSGFTLLELLIVLAIILVIAAMVVPNLVGSQQTANEKATLATIKQMEGAAGAYAADHDGVYFVASSGTDAWNAMMNPGTYKGRKLKPNLGEIPLDAWGNPLQYEWNKGGGHSKNPNAIKPAIWSLGADKSGDGTNPNGIPLNNWTSMAADGNQK